MMLEWDRTNEGSGIILDNKKNILDWETLEQVERRFSYIRLSELRRREKDANVVYDKEHFLSIHKYIFQDIYPWAGTIREVDLYKGNSAFAPARFLNSSLDELFANLKKDNYLKGFTKEETAELSSYYMLELNFIHPFREGNGRTKREFMTELLNGAGYDLGLERIDANQLVMADILAFDDNEADIKANPSYLKSLINTSISPNKEQSTKVKQGANIEQLNRFLWVYDRFDSRGWFVNKQSLQDAENKLGQLLESEQGKEKVKAYLNKIIIKEEQNLDGTADYRKEIIGTAKEFKELLDKGVKLSKGEEMEKTKETIMEKEIGQESELAGKLDKFYSYYAPYDRFDLTGSISPENDKEHNGLKQIREDLASKEGRKQIENFLKDVIANDERPDMIRQAKQLRLELYDPKNSLDNINQYLQNKKPENKMSASKSSPKKQKCIK